MSIDPSKAEVTMCVVETSSHLAYVHTFRDAAGSILADPENIHMTPDQAAALVDCADGVRWCDACMVEGSSEPSSRNDSSETNREGEKA